MRGDNQQERRLARDESSETARQNDFGRKIQSDPNSDVRRHAEMCVRHVIMVRTTGQGILGVARSFWSSFFLPTRRGGEEKGWKATKVSVIPCRLNDGLHEWRHEIATVPRMNPLNTPFRCKGRRLPVGSEDPVKLYCSL
jgi:hypothetical protein